MTRFVWLYVEQRLVLRELPRRELHRQAGRLYAPQVMRLDREPIILPERAADALCLWGWTETGEDVFGQRPFGAYEGTAEGTSERWGIPPTIGRKIDQLAELDAFLALAADKGTAGIPLDAWGRYDDPGEELLRAYYRARVNHQIQGIQAGRLTIDALHGTCPQA